MSKFKITKNCLEELLFEDQENNDFLLELDSFTSGTFVDTSICLCVNLEREIVYMSSYRTSDEDGKDMEDVYFNNITKNKHIKRFVKIITGEKII